MSMVVPVLSKRHRMVDENSVRSMRWSTMAFHWHCSWHVFALHPPSHRWSHHWWKGQEELVELEEREEPVRVGLGQTGG